MDSAQAQGIWESLSKAIDEIHNKNASALSFEELYRNAYNLVLHKHGKLLYDGVKGSVTAHLVAISGEISTCSDEQLLETLNERWADHLVTMVMVRDILMYMDRTYVTHQKKTPMYDLGLQLFRQHVVRHEKVCGRLQSLLLRNIQLEREGQLIDRILMKKSLHMLTLLGVDGEPVYEEDFEAPFLETTMRFYRAESQDFISQNTCPAYMKKAAARLAEELQRAHAYLSAPTEPKLIVIVRDELISNHAQTLVEMEGSGVVPMLRDDKLEDLRRMYDLFSGVPHTLDELRNAMYGYVKRTGRGLVQAQQGANDPVTFVGGLLTLRDKFETIVNEAFHGEKKAQKRLKEAFEDFINSDMRCASYLAQYVDDLLKSGLRGMGEDEAETRLDKVIVIFRYLQDKDIFENFYKSHLSKRLLSGRSVSDEAERMMIAKLKTECGYQYTSKLEGMFNDMHMSKDTMEQYHQAVRASGRTGTLDLEVNVLTQGYWPTQTVAPCALPSAVLPACSHFEEYYLERHTGRKVSWQTHMGNADLKVNLSGGRKHELNVSTYQMCILMLFNAEVELELSTIRVAVSIPEAELRRHLISLCTPKHRILKKSSKGKGVADDDIFSFNDDFTSKLKRVRVPLVSMSMAGAAPPGEAGEGSHLPPSVEEDRRHLMEAAIVRIMKTRKTLEHNQLVAEVTRQLGSRFQPAPLFIKKRVESLIDREYLERDTVDRKVYKYLA
jgi:cullin 3